MAQMEVTINDLKDEISKTSSRLTEGLQQTMEYVAKMARSGDTDLRGKVQAIDSVLTE
jgi:hypothetical protein